MRAILGPHQGGCEEMVTLWDDIQSSLCFIPMTPHEVGFYENYFLSFFLFPSFLLSFFFLLPVIWHQTGKAVVREDGTFQLISFVFLHLQVNQASHTYLFIYGVAPQNQSLVEENRFSFSFEMPWIWIEILCHRWKSSPLSPAPLGGPPREHRRHRTWHFRSAEWGRPDVPQCLRMRCADLRGTRNLGLSASQSSFIFLRQFSLQLYFADPIAWIPPRPCGEVWK